MIDSNYHSHHMLCNHAVGTTEDYVKKAIELGFKVLGISDHVPSETVPDSMRMPYGALNAYYDDVRDVQRRYRSLIDVYLGMECEYVESDAAYYQGFLDSVDYLVLGHHYIQHNGILQSSFNLSKPEHVLTYANEVKEAIASGYFSLLAHPDLYMCGYDTFDESCEKAAHLICQTAESYQLPIEFNANGIRRGIKQTSQGNRYPYPREEFWQIAKQYKMPIILSSDAHHPNTLYDEAMEKAEAMIQQLGLKTIQRLPIKNAKNRI